MVFEVLYPQFDFSDDTIQEIVGIFETNAIEIRLAQTEINGLYKIGSMLEHSCVPNVSLTFDDKFKVTFHNTISYQLKINLPHFQMTVKAGRDIQKGEHLSIMYTHSLWGTQARRAHLNDAKKFWCQCQRCSDFTEFGK